MTDGLPKYKVAANGFVFSLTEDDIAAADLAKLSSGEFHLLQNNRSVTTKLVSADLAAKQFTVEVAGENFAITIKDELDQELEKMGFGLSTNKQLKEIKAPMPGLVLQIAVEKGQAVNAGDKLLILGAMKMENSIMIQHAATIKKICVDAGQAVEKGQVLVELE